MSSSESDRLTTLLRTGSSLLTTDDRRRVRFIRDPTNGSNTSLAGSKTTARDSLDFSSGHVETYAQWKVVKQGAYYGFQSETGYWLGYNLTGHMVCNRRRCHNWEHFRLEEATNHQDGTEPALCSSRSSDIIRQQASSRVRLVAVHCNFGRGGYVPESGAPFDQQEDETEIEHRRMKLIPNMEAAAVFTIEWSPGQFDEPECFLGREMVQEDDDDDAHDLLLEEPFVKSSLEHICDSELQLPPGDSDSFPITEPAAAGEMFFEKFLDSQEFLFNWHKLNSGVMPAGLDVTPWCDAGESRGVNSRTKKDQVLERELEFKIIVAHIGLKYEILVKETQRWTREPPCSKGIWRWRWEGRSHMTDLPVPIHFHVEFQVIVECRLEPGGGSLSPLAVRCNAGVSFSTKTWLESQITQGTILQYRTNFKNMIHLMRARLTPSSPPQSPADDDAALAMPGISHLETIGAIARSADAPSVEISLADVESRGVLSLASHKSNAVVIRENMESSSSIPPETHLLTRWRVCHVRRGVVGLQSVVTKRWLGHNPRGVVQAAAGKCRNWEHLRLEFGAVMNDEQACMVRIVGTDWHHGNGAYYTAKDRKGGDRMLRCSPKECPAAEAAHFVLTVHTPIQGRSSRTLVARQLSYERQRSKEIILKTRYRKSLKASVFVMGSCLVMALLYYTHHHFSRDITPMDISNFAHVDM